VGRLDKAEWHNFKCHHSPTTERFSEHFSSSHWTQAHPHAPTCNMIQAQATVLHEGRGGGVTAIYFGRETANGCV
jgi:hypothetical protein